MVDSSIRRRIVGACGAENAAGRHFVDTVFAVQIAALQRDQHETSRVSKHIFACDINLEQRAIFTDASSHSCRMLLLIEMVSRAVKVLCRKRLRKLMESLTYPLEQPYIEETVQLLNSVFGGDEIVWRDQILSYISEYFGVSFGGLKTMQHSKAGREGGNDNNAEKSNQDAYDDLGSSQGSLSSSGISEKNQIAPRSTKETETVAVLATASSPPSAHVADDSGEDDEEQHLTQEKVNLSKSFNSF